jgi:hypothetical protein
MSRFGFVSDIQGKAPAQQDQRTTMLDVRELTP